MNHGYTVGEASRYLKIDAKTLHRRCRQLGIAPFVSSIDGRVKLYSQEQLHLIAQARGSHISPASSVTMPQEMTSTPGPRTESPTSQFLALYQRFRLLEQEFQETHHLMQALLATLPP